MDDKKKEELDKNEANDGVVVDEGTSDELEEVVFILLPDGTVQKRVVTTGIQDINYIEVRSGLKAGDEVVVAPYNAISKKLKNGMKVNVVSKEKLFEK
jgi:HlyD family secretion protein